MEKPPAFQFYPKDYVVSTRVIPVEARGVHTDLLCYAWIEEGLPADLEGLHTFIGLSKRKFKTIWDTHLAHRWESDGNGKLINPRQEKEREKQRRWREKSAKGGKARKGKGS
jgi:uncharacterized protein YdaU (DUF1376 family)